MKLKIGFICSCILLVLSCREKAKTYNGYTKQQNFYYKLISLGDGAKKTDTLQVIWINASCKTLTDSVFWSTKNNAAQTFFITKNSPSFLKSLHGFSVGDSLQYLFPTKFFFQEFFKSDVPLFCQKDSCVKFPVKILRALSQNEFTFLSDSISLVKQTRQKNEATQIHKYIAQNTKKVTEFAPNAYMEITQITNLDSVKKGKKIKLFYEGFFLDETLVDYTPQGKPFEFICGQEGQLIEGLQLALYRLKKGEKAKIILPSHLAFGNGGSSNGNIPPFTPLVYKVEILDIK